MLQARQATAAARNPFSWGVPAASGPPDVSIESNGNLTQKIEGSDTWTYEWDAENRLKRVLKNSVEQARFAYDPLGRRVEKVAGGLTSSYVHDMQDVLRETRSDGTVFKYIHGPATDEPLAREDGAGTWSYYHADASGSITRMTNAAGAVSLTRRYDAFGNLEVGATEPGASYTGRDWDPEAQLYYYRARYYSPKEGRFLSPDPLGFDAGVNFYAYVENNPVNLNDPSGLAAAGGWKNKCKDAKPLPPTDPTACNYGGLKVDLWYVEWDLDCVCKNAGNNPGANCVRACIQCAKESGEDVTKIAPHWWCKENCRAKGLWTHNDDKNLNDVIYQQCRRCWFE